MIDMNIKHFRKRLGFTQEQLAEKLSVSRQTLAKWENGEASPSIDDCIRMSEIFDVTVNDLAAATTFLHDTREFVFVSITFE